MNKPASLINKIRKEFEKNETVKLVDLYSTLSQDEKFKHITHLKHRIRSTLSNLKKRGKIKIIEQGTYKIIKEKDSKGFDPST